MNQKKYVVAKMCLRDMSDVDEDAELLRRLDEEDVAIEEYIYDEDLISMYGEPPEYVEISDEELERMRQEYEDEV